MNCFIKFSYIVICVFHIYKLGQFINTGGGKLFCVIAMKIKLGNCISFRYFQLYLKCF